MREHAVLYWSSERPVPKVTIDYGDGRRLVGTVTGNSIHYLLDPHGRLVDAMPGLHGPQRFLAWLQGADAMARQWAPLADAAFADRSREEHARLAQQLLAGLVAELVEQGWHEDGARAAWGDLEPEELRRAIAVSAEVAAPLTVSKRADEAPLLSAIGRQPLPPAESSAVGTLLLTPRWTAKLSPESRALVTARAPATVRTDLDSALLRMENRLAEDGLRNEAFLHRAIHQRAGARRPDCGPGRSSTTGSTPTCSSPRRATRGSASPPPSCSARCSRSPPRTDHRRSAGSGDAAPRRSGGIIAAGDRWQTSRSSG